MKSCFESVRLSAAPTAPYAQLLEEDHLSQSHDLELWGGVECTVNRVADRYFNQCEWNGHIHRLSDLDLFADLGIRAVRYPVIWETIAPEQSDQLDWQLADERLNRLHELGIRPIVDLVHHGSGPLYAPIDSPHFAPGVARFAREVAQRFPWLDAYTPINEPLTTARFCGKYGFWYPHGCDDASFVRVLINECKATVLAMRAVREINPKAQLIQTDDLGYTSCVPWLQAEADFQNHRRWLGFDLLCGMVVPKHPLWDYLLGSGIEAEEMCWFADNPCPPDVIGINYYPTSDRFLGEDTDFETVRVQESPLGGFSARLREAWERYHLPLAITEAHLGCTREEQLRWFNQAWHSARELRAEGVDVRAVTAWSLLGSYNWNSLVTRDEGHYEPGAFDTRGPQPRPTALASLLRDLSTHGHSTHLALSQPGWWERPMRLLEPKTEEPSWRLPYVKLSQGTKPQCDALVHETRSFNTAVRPLLILGASGTLGSAFARACEMRALPYYALSRCDLDLQDPEAVEAAFGQIRPWAVINASGYSQVEQAQCNSSNCYSINTQAAIQVAKSCSEHDAALLCFSSDQVFDGEQRIPYTESVRPSPLNIYGRSKAEMEMWVSQVMPQSLIVRTSFCFGPWDDSNFVTRTLRALTRNESVLAPENVVVSPTYVPDLVNISLDLLLDRECGVWHLTNVGEMSWYDLACAVARLRGVRPELIQGCPFHQLQLAPRPLYSALGSERGFLLPALEESLSRYVREAA